MTSLPSWLTRSIQGLLGLLGFYAALRLLPRLLKTLTRRFVIGLVGEILLVALSTLLTERATRVLSRRNGHGTSAASTASEDAS
jgi:hypothetical protein